MSDMQRLTTNAAGNGWVDDTPGTASTGYQTQNTNITARNLGMDLTSIRISGFDVIIEIAGPIDVNGVPYVNLAEVTLGMSSVSKKYIEVIDGPTAAEKDFALTAEEPVWDNVKGGFYSAAGNRVLNWVIVADSPSGSGKTTPSAMRLAAPSKQSPGYHKATPAPFGFVRWVDAKYSSWRNWSAGYTLPLQDGAGTGGVASWIRGVTTDNNGDLWVVQVPQVGAPYGNIVKMIGVTTAINIVDDGFLLAPADVELGSGNAQPLGIAWNHSNDTMISMDFNTKKIYVQLPPLDSSIIDEFACPGTNPTDVFVWDGNLYSADSGTNKVYKHSGITAAIVEEYDFSGILDPWGITFDGLNMIVRDYDGTVVVCDGFSTDILYKFQHLAQTNDVIDAAWVAANSTYRPTESVRGLSAHMHHIHPDLFFGGKAHRDSLIMANNFSDNGSVVGTEFNSYITIHR